MDISLGVHIIYSTTGIELSLMLMITEGLKLRRGYEFYY
jgi:cytochrome bd-type quinol oxidase subunit 1